MIILIACGCLLLGGILVSEFTSYWGTMHDIGVIMALVGGILFAIALAVLPINYYESKDTLIQYQELQKTVDDARKDNPSELERAAILDKIASANMNIKSMQYWNETSFDIFIPDEVMDACPIK